MEKQPTYPKGRRCQACGKPLSQYNKGPYCYTHQKGIVISMESPSRLVRSTRPGSPRVRGAVQIDKWN